MRYSWNWLRELGVPGDRPPLSLLADLAGIGLLSEGVCFRGDGECVFDLEIPANRGDLLSMFGLAREISALYGSAPADLPAGYGPPPADLQPGAGAGFDLKITAASGCLFYAGLMLEGVKVAPSAPADARRLETLGLRPVNNLVDVTNRLLLEAGQPLHAFDADRIAGGIEVRFARAGERIVTIDGRERTLSEKVLVIADREKVLAAAGIMGGVDSEVTSSTRRVLLESALFAPAVVRAGRQALGLETDASARFERGVNPGLVEPTLYRAASLAVREAPGSPAFTVAAGCLPPPAPPFAFRPEKVSRLLGTGVDPAESEKILARLGCRVSAGASPWQVRAPAWRGDLAGEIDLVEEIARFYGYDRVEPVLPAIRLVPFPADPPGRKIVAIGDFLVKAGFSEVVTTSFSGAAGGGDRALEVINPLSEDQARLRTGLLEGLVRVGNENTGRGCARVRFFESGAVYRAENGGRREAISLALLETARTGAGATDLKPLLLEVARLLGVADLAVVPGPDARFRQGAALLSPGGGLFAEFGIVEGEKTCYEAAEVYLSDWLNGGLVVPEFSRWAKYPAVIRDYSFLAPDGVAWSRVEREIRAAAGIVGEVRFQEIYRASDLPGGMHGLTLSVAYRAPERTLVGAEVDEVQARVIAALAAIGLRLRER